MTGRERLTGGRWGNGDTWSGINDLLSAWRNGRASDYSDRASTSTDVYLNCCLQKIFKQKTNYFSVLQTQSSFGYIVWNFHVNKKYVLSNSESVQCNFFIFDHITWRSPSSKSAAVYNISWKSDDFHWDMAIYRFFKMAAVRHLGIVLPPHETTHEVSVAGRSCLSNFMSIWHTDLKIQLFEFFAYLAWNAYSGPKMGVLWTLDPYMWLFIIETPKRHILE